MRLGPRGEALIKSFEKLALVAYKRFPSEPWTCGWGHTRGVTQHTTCDETQAQRWFIEDTDEAVETVNLHIYYPLSQNEFDALVSFTFNVGCFNASHSTLFGLVNVGHFELASKEFAKWNHVDGRVVEGLTKRREAERDLFNLPEEA